MFAVASYLLIEFISHSRGLYEAATRQVVCRIEKIYFFRRFVSTTEIFFRLIPNAKTGHMCESWGLTDLCKKSDV